MYPLQSDYAEDNPLLAKRDPSTTAARRQADLV